MNRDRINFFFLNVGHFMDHLCMLVFATVAALRLAGEWNMTYSELIPYATPGFIAFGVFAIPAGWLADKWSREGMLAVFFIGIGLSAAATALADTPLQIGAGLLAIGLFASIYHPVGLAMVVQGRDKTGIPLAINGVFGNMGVACAALVTGFLIDVAGWRTAFAAPAALSVAIGLGYILFLRGGRTATGSAAEKAAPAAAAGSRPNPESRAMLARIFAVILVTTAIGGLVFQSTTFALPKVFDERLGDIAGSATLIGGYAFVVFAFAAVAQLVVGFLVDRHSIRTVFAAVAALQAIFLSAMIQLSGIAAVLVAVAFMLAVFGQIPINDVLIGRIARSEWRSRVYALRYIVTFSVSATAVPIIAWVHLEWGFSALFGLLAAAAAVILTAALALPGTAAVTGRTAPAAADTGAD
jgi:MFS family permease